MLGLGENPQVAADVIKDATEASFMADVIEASQEVPVIVDFWATWCGPCKTLGPMLEAAVTAAKGKVSMVKVDVDQNQRIAAQLRIQSIPTVYAFWQGQPVDGFQGAVPASELKAFVERVSALGGDGGLGRRAASGRGHADRRRCRRCRRNLRRDPGRRARECRRLRGPRARSSCTWQS